MQIEIVSVEQATKLNKSGKPYNTVTVVYRDEQGRVSQKVVMGFGATANAARDLANAVSGQRYNVDYVKNASGYNDWVDVSLISASSGATPFAAPAAAAGSNSKPKSVSNFETSEERAKKQVYIVRQSSLANAVATLSVGSKTAPKPEEVIAVARKYEQYVFDTELKVDTELPASAPSGSFSDLEDDVEF